MDEDKDEDKDGDKDGDDGIIAAVAACSGLRMRIRTMIMIFVQL